MHEATLTRLSQPSEGPLRAPSAPGAKAGWHIDSMTLRPVIDDPETFEREFAHDDARDAIRALWSGDPVTARERCEAMLKKRPSSVRLRALLADCRRDLGETDQAIADYRVLLEECRGTAWEAVLHQHLGTALFVAGHFDLALTAFAQAYELRVFAGGDPSLIDSSMAAISRTQHMLEIQHRARRHR